jgi:hypothetical protein
LCALRSCDPDSFQDPADLRSEPNEDELEEQYLIYGLFERADRPDGAFLSKRWCNLEDILERTPPGNLLNKIREWEAGRAARARNTFAAVFEAAEAEAEAEAEAVAAAPIGGAESPS